MVNQSSSDQDVLEKSLFALIQVLNKNKGKLILSMLIGGVLGIASSFLVSKKYSARAQLLPEFSTNQYGNLGSLASLAGLDGSSGDGDAIRPDLFPNILQSSPALLNLLSQPVKTDSGKSYLTLLAFYENKNKVNVDHNLLTRKITEILYQYKPNELAIISELKGSISSNFDKKSGIIQIEVEMTDPTVAATTLTNSLKYLRDYVLEYRYGKKQDQGEFIKAQLKAAKERMEKARYALQAYRDNNRNVFLNTAKIKEQKLQEEYTITFSVYNDLLGESERSNISSKEQKPLFQVLEPPLIPATKSGPNRLFFGIGGAIAFCLLTLLFILLPWKSIFRKKDASL